MKLAELKKEIELIRTHKMKTLPYYSGNIALDCSPTAGTWDNDIFTADDGSKWTIDPSDDSPHPRMDATGMHYLIPA
jgi:hypothetical protein